MTDERLTRRELFSKPRPATQDTVVTGHVSSGIGYLIMVRVDEPLEGLIPSGTPVTVTLHEPVEYRTSVVLADETTELLASTKLIVPDDVARD